MTRLYCPKEVVSGSEILINDRKQVHYLCNVLRLKLNDDVFAFDGQGNEYRCKVQELSKKIVRLLIKEELKIKPQSKSYLAVACSLPKQKSTFDDLVDKLSQLGVDKIIPMITERVIVRWNSDQKQRHHQRWYKIAKQACAQSGRNTLPIIEPIKEIGQILAYGKSFDLKLIPTLIQRKQNLGDIISDSLPKSILVLIGPEGDFTDQELTQAREAGFTSVFLGDLVLRVDTAAIAVAAFFKLYERTYS